MFRKPSTAQEKRQTFNNQGTKVRSKRDFSKLPNDWDDYTPTIQKTWKVYRKTQYR